MRSAIYFFDSKFHFLALRFSDSYRKKLDIDLRNAGLDFTPEQYISFCIGIAFGAAVLSMLSFLFLPEYAAPLFLLTFALAFLAVRADLRNKGKKRIKKIENEIASLLRIISVELKIGQAFEQCTQRLPDLNVHSRFVKKVSAQLAEIYRKGSDPGVLRKLASEHDAEQRIKLREYNGKLVMYSLFFIAVSAILPAMFQIFIIIGSSFLIFDIPPALAMLIPALLFPCLSASVFLLIRSRRP